MMLTKWLPCLISIIRQNFFLPIKSFEVRRIKKEERGNEEMRKLRGEPWQPHDEADKSRIYCPRRGGQKEGQTARAERSVLGAVGTHRRRKAEKKMNVWYIALWMYMVAGEAILLAVAFNICRKQAKKAQHQGKNNRRRAWESSYKQVRGKYE